MESRARRLRPRQLSQILMWVVVACILAALFGLIDIGTEVILVLIGASIVLFLVGYRGPSPRDWSAFHDTYGRVGGDDGGA